MSDTKVEERVVDQSDKKDEVVEVTAEVVKEQRVQQRKPTELKTYDEVLHFIKVNHNRLLILMFIQDWAENCASTYNVVVELANDLSFEFVAFAEVVAEDHPDICKEFEIVGVPSVLMFRKGKEIDRIVGVRVREVASKMKFHSVNNVCSSNLEETSPPGVENPESKKALLNQQLKKLIGSEKVMVFMKGNPSQPRCGFSRTLMEILTETGVPFGTFDILIDDDVRQGLKEYSNWQTYPQVYVNSQLIGGLDIIKELKASDELLATLSEEPVESTEKEC